MSAEVKVLESVSIKTLEDVNPNLADAILKVLNGSLSATSVHTAIKNMAAISDKDAQATEFIIIGVTCRTQPAGVTANFKFSNVIAISRLLEKILLIKPEDDGATGRKKFDLKYK